MTSRLYFLNMNVLRIKSMIDNFKVCRQVYLAGNCTFNVDDLLFL